MLSPEEWRPFPGFEETHEVSDQGRVRRSAPARGVSLGALNKTHKLPKGYLLVTIAGEGKRKTFLLNRVVCEAFHGPPPSSVHEAAHTNGVRDDNRADNLSWKTPAENCADKVKHGTMPNRKGVLNPAAKMNEDTVREIRKLKTAGAKPCDIASKFGLSLRHTYLIASGESWEHVI